MRTKYNVQFLLLAGIMLTGVFVVFVVAGAEGDLLSVVYPVKELNNCRNEAECRAFCDDGDNILPCVDFAEKHGLMLPEEAAEARKFARLGGQGPGGCTDKVECINYCEDVAHIEECVDFASRHGFIGEEDLTEAKKVAEALRGGAKLPGNCRGKDQCEAYCNDLDHINECLDFAEKSGFLAEDELAEARKAAQAIGSGARPPGGCKNKKECEAFCDNPANQEVCFSFGREHGFISAEDEARMQEGLGQLEEALSQAPPEVMSCIEAQVGAEKLAKIRAGQAAPSPQIGSIIQTCFVEALVVPGGDEFGPSGEFGGSDFEGTGSREDIERYYQDHGEPPSEEEIKEFVPEEFREFIPEEGEELPPKVFEQGSAPAGDQINSIIQQRIQGETQKRIEEETQKRIQEEIQRQIQNQGGLPVGPGSVLWPILNLLRLAL